MANLFDGELDGKKIALIWAAAAALGGAYGMGLFSPRPAAAPQNAKIDWNGEAKPRFAKLDDAEKAWEERSIEADRPKAAGKVAEAPAAEAPPPASTGQRQADPAEEREGPGVPE